MKKVLVMLLFLTGCTYLESPKQKELKKAVKEYNESIKEFNESVGDLENSLSELKEELQKEKENLLFMNGCISGILNYANFIGKPIKKTKENALKIEHVCNKQLEERLKEEEGVK